MFSNSAIPSDPLCSIFWLQLKTSQCSPKESGKTVTWIGFQLLAMMALEIINGYLDPELRDTQPDDFGAPTLPPPQCNC